MTTLVQEFTLDAGDGYPLKTYQFSPEEDFRGTVVIAIAMGTTQSYYHPLAKWLAQRGFQVFTFDYRGMGESKHQALKQYDTNILDWAKLDCSAVLAKAIDSAAGKPLYWIGHSLGGQIFPLVDGIDRVDKVVTIASGTGYWKHNAPQLKRKVWFLWYFLVPVLLRLYGYFPGAKIGMVGDLPRRVMSQWRRWCMHPKYCVGVEDEGVGERFKRVDNPLLSLAMEDDEMLSARNIQGLFELFGTAQKELKFIHPQQYGHKRIGHLGFFRSEFADSLWTGALLPELEN